MPVKTWSTPIVSEEKQSIPCVLCGSRSFKDSISCEGFSYVSCLSCGLVQMNPQPLEAEIKNRYCDKKNYLDYELANEEAFLKLQLLALNDSGFFELEKQILSKSSFDPSPNSPPRILDIGCATGSLLEYMKNRGWEVTGVEISASQAEYGKQKRKLDIRNLTLKENNFPFKNFNVVLASHLIEHLNDPAALVKEVRRILSPQGRFFVTTPNIAGFQARLFKGRWRSAIFDHLFLFSVKTLSRLLLESGFLIEKVSTWGGLAQGIAPSLLKSVFDKAAKRFGFGDVMIIRARNQP